MSEGQYRDCFSRCCDDWLGRVSEQCGCTMESTQQPLCSESADHPVQSLTKRHRRSPRPDRQANSKQGHPGSKTETTRLDWTPYGHNGERALQNGRICGPHKTGVRIGGTESSITAAYSIPHNRQVIQCESEPSWDPCGLQDRPTRAGHSSRAACTRGTH